MKKFKDFYNAWRYLNTTDVFWHEKLEKFALRDDNGKLEYNEFRNCLSIEVVKVNPETNEIDDNERLNTKTEVWLECGEPFLHNGAVCYASHNINYDCGGDTFEEAVVNLANLVYKHNKQLDE